MSSLLAIETSTEACSVALLHNGELSEQFEVMPRLHARKLLPMVNQLLTDSGVSLHNLDAIAFARGPGSFTGLRIAASVAQGLAFGADLEVVPVSTLETLAQGARRVYQCKAVLPMLDARMKEVYWSCYYLSETGLLSADQEHLTSPQQVCDELPDAALQWVGIGSGWRLLDQLPDKLPERMQRIEPDFYPQAQDVATLAARYWEAGKAVTPAESLPVYIRGESAWKKMEQQQGG